MHVRHLVPVLALAVVTLASPLGASAGRTPPGAAAAASANAVVPYPGHCRGWTNAGARADELLANRWQLAIHPTVTLPANRSWTENPLGDNNWQFVDHSLRALHSLFQTYAVTGDERYRNRAVVLIRDWVTDNPRIGSRSPWAWNDHATALRATVLACATTYVPMDAWFLTALRTHGQTLADPGFYVGVGNHALNQSLGLLEIAHVLRRADWKTLAVNRLSTLAARSIDAQGVTNEQAVGYQQYNFGLYSAARQRILALGLTPPASFARVLQMPTFLAHATLPNGEYEMIGDTDRRRATSIPGTFAEFAATQGRTGRVPGDTVALYWAGYLFARTGWGATRPYADETFMSLRWGPAQFIHGHADHGSVTLYGAGSRLLVDPGKYTYNRDAYRTFFTGRSAHNVVTVDGVAWNRSAASTLLNQSRDARMVTARVRMTGNAGVTHVRGVTFSRRLGYVLVDDRLSSSSGRVYRQLWHLTEDARPYVQPTHFHTQRARGNVQVRQLIGSGTTSRVVAGQTSPIQGWVAWEFGKRLRAPVVEFRRAGGNVRFLTLLVPSAGAPSSSVSQLALTSTGYTVVVSIGGRRERVSVDGATVSITPLN